MKKKLREFLEEDISKGDITSSLIPRKKCVARIFAKQSCTVSGLEEAVFLFKTQGIAVKQKAKDGGKVGNDETVLEIIGDNRKILSTERTALNVISRMSGISTITKKAIELLEKKCNASERKIKRIRTLITCTRKTFPGFNEFDKKAVEIAGGWPHRKNLNEMIMIKDNHLIFVGIKETVAFGKKKFKGKKIEIEVQNEKQLREAIESKADIIMLDNFSPEKAEKAIEAIHKQNRHVQIELSGGITLKNLRRYGRLSADFISLGEITHSVKAMDFSLEIIKK